MISYLFAASSLFVGTPRGLFYFMDGHIFHYMDDPVIFIGT